ncbi:hypothetical protein PR003_g24991 [Phytophthora rubi]|uniref:Armadillo-type fold n=1 Tax=Phytophthora rubi TaxID=129364 RepID=A0A6A3IHD3_9STRA|nr:hypothetical protein PR002_g24280 [Phytophthora rubi]KAE9291596.1 hypothetical protein PR003_g24991 [Phytophthora rubi]
MDLALSIVGVLRQIHDLRDAIRRQRHVNRRTYLRMMEIYVELHSSDAVQVNATLTRTATLDKFSAAVTKFLLYLQKYNDMHKVVRLFKFTTMEEQRLKIVDEIDQLYRMLNLATAVAVMNGAAAASSNAARLFAKLEDMHGTIQLTHDQIHDALLADKQQVVVSRKKLLLHHEEPVVEKSSANRGVLVRQAPILKKYAPAAVEDDEVGGDLMAMMEEKTPVDAKAELEPSIADVVVGTKLLAVENVEVEDLKQTTADDEEEKEPSNRQLTLVQEVTGEMEKYENKPRRQELVPIVPIQSTVAESDVKEEEDEERSGHRLALIPDAIDEVDNEKEGEEDEELTASSSDKQLGEVVEVEENEPGNEQPASTQDAADIVVEVDEAEQNDLMKNTVQEVVEEMEKEENKTSVRQSCALILDDVVDEPTCDPAEKVIEDNEMSSQQSSSSSDTADETEEEENLPHHPTAFVCLDHSSVPLFIQRLSSDETTAQQKEEALLDLLRMCITNSNRVQVYKTKGIPVLSKLVREGETFFSQLYALHGLSWFTFSFCKLRESEFESLLGCVREPTHTEMLSLLHELQSDDDEVKERAALQCSCMATGGAGDALRRVGVLPLLVGLLENGTANQKLWATEALVTLASDSDDNCVAITRAGAIPPLVGLLRFGTDMHKQEAAYALGNLAANNDENRAKIAREGAIPPMVEFVKSVADAQNQWAVYALGSLALNNEENRVLIAQEGAIRPLVKLLRVGTRAQKQWSAYTLGSLAHSDANREEITLEGAIAPLIELLRAGTAMQKQRAAFALGNLACGSNTTTDFDEAILPLVDLVRVGSDTQKEDAAYTLGNLAANNDARRAKIRHQGAIAPLVKLLKTGDGEQKQWAAFALRYLAHDNDSNRAAIVKEGAIEPLAAMMEEGSEEQKEEAAHALEHLVVKENGAAANTFIPETLLGYLRAEAISQNANVAATAALNTLGTMREGVIPLIRRFVKPDVDAERADPKSDTKGHSMAGAW